MYIITITNWWITIILWWMINNWWLTIHDNLDENNDYPVINHYNPLHGILRQTHVSRIRSVRATAFFCFGSFSCEPWTTRWETSAVTGWLALWNRDNEKWLAHDWLPNIVHGHLGSNLKTLRKHDGSMGHHFPYWNDHNDHKMVGKPSIFKHSHLAASPSIHVVVAPKDGTFS